MSARLAAAFAAGQVQVGGQQRVGGSYGLANVCSEAVCSLLKIQAFFFFFLNKFFGLLSPGVAGASFTVLSCMVGGLNVLCCIPTFNTYWISS